MSRPAIGQGKRPSQHRKEQRKTQALHALAVLGAFAWPLALALVFGVR